MATGLSFPIPDFLSALFVSCAFAFYPPPSYLSMVLSAIFRLGSASSPCSVTFYEKHPCSNPPRRMMLVSLRRRRRGPAYSRILSIFSSIFRYEVAVAWAAEDLEGEQNVRVYEAERRREREGAANEWEIFRDINFGSRNVPNSDSRADGRYCRLQQQRRSL